MFEQAEQGCQPSPPLCSLQGGPGSLALSRSSPHRLHLFLVSLLCADVSILLQLALDVLNPLTIDAATGNMRLTEQLVNVTEADLVGHWKGVS